MYLFQEEIYKEKNKQKQNRATLTHKSSKQKKKELITFHVILYNNFLVNLIFTWFNQNNIEKIGIESNNQFQN